MKRMALALAGVALVVGLVGCGAEKPAAESTAPTDTAVTAPDPTAVDVAENTGNENLPPTIGDVGFTFVTSDHEGVPHMVHYAFTYSNPNADSYFSFPTFRVTAYGADGTILASDDNVLMNGFAGGTYAVSSLFEVTEEPDRVEVVFVDSKTGSHSKDGVDPYFHETTNVVFADKGFTSTVTGEVVSGAPGVVDIRIDIVARDASGAIIGGGFGFVDSVQPGVATPFEIMLFQSDVEPATIEAYAQDW